MAELICRQVVCQIADLYVEVPEARGMAPRLRDYRIEKAVLPDIVIREEQYRPNAWCGFSEEGKAYMESGACFYGNLLRFQGIMLHSSAVALDGKAYLFSGPCGMGKSTHTRLWQQVFGENAKVFNDDKPALRRLDDRWYAYGTPWCGKDGININMKVPLAGICFLKQSKENRIRRLNSAEALPLLLSQTMRKFKDSSNTILLLEHLDKLIREIPIFELENLPVPDAARLSYETMRRAAEEVGL